MSSKSIEPQEVRLSVVPSDASRFAPSVYANVMRVAIDPHSATLYFFSVPGDIGESSKAEKSLREGQLAADPSGLTLHLQMEAVAKLAVPIRELPGLISALQRQYDQWKSLQGKEEKTR